MLEVLHELVDAVASLKVITGNRQAELHALLDQAEDALDTGAHAAKPAPAAVKADVPA